MELQILHRFHLELLWRTFSDFTAPYKKDHCFSVWQKHKTNQRVCSRQSVLNVFFYLFLYQDYKCQTKCVLFGTVVGGTSGVFTKANSVKTANLISKFRQHWYKAIKGKNHAGILTNWKKRFWWCKQIVWKRMCMCLCTSLLDHQPVPKWNQNMS